MFKWISNYLPWLWMRGRMRSGLNGSPRCCNRRQDCTASECDDPTSITQRGRSRGSSHKAGSLDVVERLGAGRKTRLSRDEWNAILSQICRRFSDCDGFRRVSRVIQVTAAVRLGLSQHRTWTWGRRRTGVRWSFDDRFSCRWDSRRWRCWSRTDFNGCGWSSAWPNQNK